MKITKSMLLKWQEISRPISSPTWLQQSTLRTYLRTRLNMHIFSPNQVSSTHRKPKCIRLSPLSFNLKLIRISSSMTHITHLATKLGPSALQSMGRRVLCIPKPTHKILMNLTPRLMSTQWDKISDNLL